MKKTPARQKLKYIQMMLEGHLYWQMQSDDGNDTVIDTIIYHVDLDKDSEFLEIYMGVDEDKSTWTGMSNTSTELLVDVWYMKPIEFADLHENLRRWLKRKSFNKEFKKLIGV